MRPRVDDAVRRPGAPLGPARGPQRYALVRRASLRVVDELGVIRERGGGGRYAIHDPIEGAPEQGLGRGAAARRGAGRPDHCARGRHCAALVVEIDPDGKPEHRPLVELDLVVAEALPGGECGHPDRAEDLPPRQGHVVRPHGEVLDRRVACAFRTLDAERRIERHQQRPGIRMRLGEAEVPAERPGGAHAGVRDPRDEACQLRLAGADQGRGGDAPVRGERADLQGVLHLGHTIESGDRLEVHEGVVPETPVLHRQKKLRAAGIEGHVIGTRGEQFAGLRQTGGLEDAERVGEARHQSVTPPRARPRPAPRIAPRGSRRGSADSPCTDRCCRPWSRRGRRPRRRRRWRDMPERP